MTLSAESATYTVVFDTFDALEDPRVERTQISRTPRHLVCDSLRTVIAGCAKSLRLVRH